jgi:hypothetical protein
MNLFPLAFVIISVAEPHQFYAAPAQAQAPAPAPAPTLLFRKASFLKRTKIYTQDQTILFIDSVRFILLKI